MAASGDSAAARDRCLNQAPLERQGDARVAWTDMPFDEEDMQVVSEQPIEAKAIAKKARRGKRAGRNRHCDPAG